MNIIKATNKTHIKDSFLIRDDVFIKEQGVPKEIEHDALDQTATHIICYENDKPVSCLRYIPYLTGAKLQRMAVLKAYRGKGIGRAMINEAEVFMKADGYQSCFLDAQVHAALFYQQLGYEIISEPFEEVNIMHVSMKKKLTP